MKKFKQEKKLQLSKSENNIIFLNFSKKKKVIFIFLF